MFYAAVGVLGFLLKKPLGGFLQARTDQIRAELADAKEKTARAEVELQQAKDLIASLDSEVEKAKNIPACEIRGETQDSERASCVRQ